MTENTESDSRSPVETTTHVDRPPRFPGFNGLRALAAILIIGVHTAWESGFSLGNSLGKYTARLDIGVMVFFLISGFLLYRPFAVAHLRGVARPKTGSFWVRRLLRILPAYWVALFFLTTVFHNIEIGAFGWRSYAVNYFLLQTYTSDQGFNSQILYGITQAWSLCVEMSFYFFIPFFAMAVGWRRLKRTVNGRLAAELIGLALMCVISGVWRIYVMKGASTTSLIGERGLSWLPAYFDLFALGMFLAVMSAWMHQEHREPWWLRHRSMPWIAWGIALLCFVLVAHLGIPTYPLYVKTLRDGLRQELYALFAFFLLAPAVFGPQDQTLVRKFLNCWPMASIGAISYAIYLWHQAVVSWISTHFHSVAHSFVWLFLATLVLVIPIATASYFIVEKPALRLKNSFTWFNRSTTAILRDDSPSNDPSS